MKLGVNCYSPIAETHAVQMFSDVGDAMALGLAVPPTLLARADEVIE
jgi:hypothetical protein